MEAVVEMLSHPEGLSLGMMAAQQQQLVMAETRFTLDSAMPIKELRKKAAGKSEEARHAPHDSTSKGGEEGEAVQFGKQKYRKDNN
jgi:hypothetical protein